MKVIFFSPKFHPDPNYYINDVVFDIKDLDRVIICGRNIDSKSFIIKSHAKINLALNVTGKKKNLHKIESLISFINLHDLINLKKTLFKYIFSNFNTV